MRQPRFLRGLEILVLALCTFSVLGAFAADKTGDAQMEARLKTLSQELRCLVCQNTTLADSTAPLAEDLRNEIRTLMQDGKNDEEIKSYLVQRYGDFVLYRPPVQSNTFLLWFGPFALLIIAVIAFYFMLKKRASQTEQ
jgi:cytochrome c-type biogenesis protein CcmH